MSIAQEESPQSLLLQGTARALGKAAATPDLSGLYTGLAPPPAPKLSALWALSFPALLFQHVLAAQRGQLR